MVCSAIHLNGMLGDTFKWYARNLNAFRRLYCLWYFQSREIKPRSIMKILGERGLCSSHCSDLVAIKLSDQNSHKCDPSPDKGPYGNCENGRQIQSQKSLLGFYVLTTVFQLFNGDISHIPVSWTIFF